MVSEQRRVLVPAPGEVLEPLGEATMQARTAGSAQSPVRDLTGQRVLEGELSRALERRSRPRANEVPLLEQREARRTAVEKRLHGFTPEVAPDHRRCLERFSLERRELIDARREHGLDRIRNRRRLEMALVADARKQLFEKEWISLSPFEHDLLHRAGGALDQAGSLAWCQRLEPKRRRVAAPSPPGPDVEELWPRGAHEQERTGDLGDQLLEKVEKIGLSPVQILDHQRSGPLADQPADQFDPRSSKLLDRREWVKVAGHIEPERQAEDLPSGQAGLGPRADHGQDLRERPVGKPATV